jgi:hypothetical protein
MQTLVRAFIIVFVSIFFIPSSEAQILGRLQRKLERKLENKLEDELDKALSKKVDEELNQDTTLRKDNREGGYDRTGAALFEGMMGSKFDMSDVELPDAYHFKGRLTYQIQSEEEKDALEVTYLFPEAEENVLGFKTTDSEGQYFIWDLDRDVIVMYTVDEEGNKNILKLPNMVNEQLQTQEDSEEYTIEASGRTKTILGYSCAEYIMTGSDIESHAWIAKDFPFNVTDFSALMAQQAQNPSFQTLQQKGGMALEIITYMGEDKKDKTHMIATSFSEEKEIIQNTPQ